MNFYYAKLKNYLYDKKKRAAGLKYSVEEDERLNEVESQVKFLMSFINDSEDEETQIHSLKCLSKFIDDFSYIKKFLTDHYKATKYTAVRQTIKEMHDGKLDTSEIDATIKRVRDQKKLEQKIRSELNIR